MHYRPHGIILKKPRCADLSLTWQQTAVILDSLIAKGRYLTPEEREKYRPQKPENGTGRNGTAEKDSTAKPPGTAKPVPPRTNQPDQGHARNDSGTVPPRQTASPDSAKPPRQPTEPSVSQTGTGNEIDEALRKWNGDADSKRRVAEYMAVHGRERETAAWLAREYGAEDERVPLHLNIPGVEGDTVLSWPQVQRRIAILLRQGRFLTPEDSAVIAPLAPAPVETVPPPGEMSRPVVEPTENSEAGHTLPPEHTESTGADHTQIGQPVQKKPAKTRAANPDSPIEVPKPTEPAVPADPSLSAKNTPDQPVPPVRIPGVGNFHITDEHLGEGKPKDRFRANMDAIQTLKTIENEGRSATREEQEILSRYVGWGGLADVFDPEKKTWKREYQELRDALTPEEYEAARASILGMFQNE